MNRRLFLRSAALVPLAGLVNPPATSARQYKIRKTVDEATYMLDVDREIKKRGLLDGKWLRNARSCQLPPDFDWNIWILAAENGWGRTRAAAEWVRQRANEGRHIAIIGSTANVVREVMVEDVRTCGSGIMQVCSIKDTYGVPTYMPTRRQIYWEKSDAGIQSTATLYTLNDTLPMMRGCVYDTLWLHLEDKQSMDILPTYDRSGALSKDEHRPGKLDTAEILSMCMRPGSKMVITMPPFGEAASIVGLIYRIQGMLLPKHRTVFWQVQVSGTRY